MNVPTGGATEDDTAYLSSGGVVNTVCPAATMLTSRESKMSHTIALTDDQVSLISELVKTVNKESTEEILDLDDRRRLYETLNKAALLVWYSLTLVDAGTK